MKVGRVILEEEETAKRERYPQVLSVEKAATRRATGWHALPRRRDANVSRGRGQVLQARHYVYHTKRPRDALPDRMSRAEN